MRALLLGVVFVGASLVACKGVSTRNNISGALPAPTTAAATAAPESAEPAPVAAAPVAAAPLAAAPVAEPVAAPAPAARTPTAPARASRPVALPPRAAAATPSKPARKASRPAPVDVAPPLAADGKPRMANENPYGDTKAATPATTKVAASDMRPYN